MRARLRESAGCAWRAGVQKNNTEQQQRAPDVAKKSAGAPATRPTQHAEGPCPSSDPPLATRAPFPLRRVLRCICKSTRNTHLMEASLPCPVEGTEARTSARSNPPSSPSSQPPQQPPVRRSKSSKGHRVRFTPNSRLLAALHALLGAAEARRRNVGHVHEALDLLLCWVCVWGGGECECECVRESVCVRVPVKRF